jgi:radical SAM protein with 4Fe4S-binding SPASM domain
LKLDSGSHPTLYRLGVALHRTSPHLWDYGIQAVTLPSRISSGLKLKFGDRGDAGKINSVNLELTVMCNLRCKMCWWWGENGIAFKLIKERNPRITRELSTDEVFNIVDQLEPHKPSFYLSGGEPFIRKDTVDIIEYISSKDMSVVTTSNGTLLSEDKLERIAKIRNLAIDFSIDGPMKVHDKIRGQGVFGKATKTIKRLLELRGSSMYPAIKTNTTFSPLILGHMDELISYLQNEVGVDAVMFQHLWFTDKAHAEAHKKVLKEVFGTDERGVDAHVMSTPELNYVEKLAEEIMQIEKIKYSKPVFIHWRTSGLTKEQISRYYTDLSFTKRNRCFVAWYSIIIKANGDVMFCPDEWMTDFKLGNIRMNKIDEMWHSEKARKFREELYKRKLFPACARCCVING